MSVVQVEKSNNLVEENVGLVHACANKMRNKGIEYDELFSAGCEGLVKAARGFDNSLGFKFSTYAVPVILGEIKRLFRDGGAIKVSRSVREMSIRVLKVKNSLSVSLGREPLIGEIASELGCSAEEIIVAQEASAPVLSLTVENDGDDIQLDVSTECIENKIIDSVCVSQLLKMLNEYERQLIVLRFFEEKTQSEIAIKLGLSQVQVSRKEKAILMKLRSNLINNL